MQSVILDATIDALPKLMGWVENQAASINFPVKQIQLALEEAVVNIIHYAYQDGGGKITITFNLQGNGLAKWEIRDSGIPFDPTKPTPAVDQASRLERRQEGGIGLILMKKFMNEIHYERIGEENVLTLIRKLEGKR